MLSVTDILFYLFAMAATVSALLVIVTSNPIYSALFLALSMSVLGALFFLLEAYFVSVAQITVYAGAVMVLFVMVLMLFDLKADKEEIFKVSPLNIIKILSTALLCGFLVGSGWLALSAARSTSPVQSAIQENRADLEKLAGPIQGKGVRPEDEDLTNAEKNALVEMAPPVLASPAPEEPVPLATAEEFGSTVGLSKLLFTRYVFAFEAVSLLLLIAIVGSVALARSKGGTHHASK